MQPDLKANLLENYSGALEKIEFNLLDALVKLHGYHAGTCRAGDVKSCEFCAHQERSLEELLEHLTHENRQPLAAFLTNSAT